MYKSEFEYKPTSRRAPCYKERLCKHHRITNGECRKSCVDFNNYEIEKDNQYSKKKSCSMLTQYKRESKIREYRKAK